MEQYYDILEKFKENFLADQKQLQKMFIQLSQKINTIKNQDSIKEDSLLSGNYYHKKFQNLYNDLQEFINITCKYNEETTKNVLFPLRNLNNIQIPHEVLPDLIKLYQSYDKLKVNTNAIFNDFMLVSNYLIKGKLLPSGILLDHQTYGLMIANILKMQYLIYKHSIRIIDSYNQNNEKHYT